MSTIEVYNKNSPLTWKQYLRGNLFTLAGNAVIVSMATQSINRKLQETGDNITSGLSEIKYGIEDVSAGIEGLRSSFNYGMLLIISKLEIQQKQFSGMLEKLNEIHTVLENPNRTEAREFRTMGLERLERKLLDKSLESFLQSLEKEDTDFFVQLQVGKLYLAGIDEDVDVIDIQKAEKHLRDAIRYAKADIEILPEAKKYYIEACFHGSVAYYLQAIEKLKENKKEEAEQFLNEAIILAKRAVEISPNFSEALYYCAKYYTLLGNKEEAFKYLEEAIIQDADYKNKINKDHDFDNTIVWIENEYKGSFYERVKKEAENAIIYLQQIYIYKYKDYKGVLAKRIMYLIKNNNKIINISEKSNIDDLLNIIASKKQIHKFISQAESPFILPITKESLSKEKTQQIPCFYCDEFFEVKLREYEKQTVKCSKCDNTFYQRIKICNIVRPSLSQIILLINKFKYMGTENPDGDVHAIPKVQDFYNAVSEEGLNIEYFKNNKRINYGDIISIELGYELMNVYINRSKINKVAGLKYTKDQVEVLFYKLIDKFIKSDKSLVLDLNIEEFRNICNEVGLDSRYFLTSSYAGKEEYTWQRFEEGKIQLIWYMLYEKQDEDIRKNAEEYKRKADEMIKAVNEKDLKKQEEAKEEYKEKSRKERIKEKENKEYVEKLEDKKHIFSVIRILLLVCIPIIMIFGMRSCNRSIETNTNLDNGIIRKYNEMIEGIGYKDRIEDRSDLQAFSQRLLENKNDVKAQEVARQFISITDEYTYERKSNKNLEIFMACIVILCPILIGIICAKLKNKIEDLKYKIKYNSK